MVRSTRAAETRSADTGLRAPAPALCKPAGQAASHLKEQEAVVGHGSILHLMPLLYREIPLPQTLLYSQAETEEKLPKPSPPFSTLI